MLSKHSRQKIDCLLTVIEQGKKWHSESADPAKALGPSDILDRIPVVDISDRWSFLGLGVHTDL